MALRVLAIACFPCELRADFRAVWLLTVVLVSTNCRSEELSEASKDRKLPTIWCELVCKRRAILDKSGPLDKCKN